MTLRRTVLLMAGCALAASSAAAQQRQVTLTNAGSVTAHGYFVGPYQGSVPGLPTLDLFCVDFLNAARLGQMWTANFTSLADLLADVPGALGTTRFGPLWGAGAVSRYQKAVWLATQFALNGTGSWGGIHGAIWDIFTPTDNPSWPERLPWLAAANTAQGTGFGSIEWQYWHVVTDVNTVNGQGGTQEYLVYVTPEPGVLILLATGGAGILLLGFARRGSA